MDELIKLEDKIDKMIGLINELKQRVQTLEDENNRLKSQEYEVRRRVDGLIGKVDSLLI